MKYLAVALLASAVNAAAVPAGPELPYYMGTPVDPARLQPRQGVADIIGGGISGLIGGAMNAGGGGKVGDPAGAAPRKAVLAARIPGAKTVKLRYGPYRIPDVSKINGPSGHGGTIYNLPDVNVDMPCKDCTLVGLNAGLELPDGTNANIDTGLWLHHYVHFVVGSGRTDSTCGGSFSLPHMLIGATSTTSERIFASGNERTHFNAPKWANTTAPNAGYYLRNTDKMALIVDLMNENTVEKTVYVTVTYDYLDGQPAGLDDLKPVWFDVNQCSTSEVSPPQQSGKFVITAQPWRANVEGEVYGWIGHLHDGGASVEMEVDGKSICTATAKYAETPEFISGSATHAHGGRSLATRAEGMKHISSIKVCGAADNTVKQMKKSQTWVLKGYYDYDKYPGEKAHSGRQDNIMGISIMYVRVPRGSATSGKTVVPQGAGGILADILAGAS